MFLAALCLCGFAEAPVKWVDFNASEWALKECLRYEQEFYGGDSGYAFADAVAYLACKNGNRFSVKTDRKNLAALVKKLRAGEKFADLYPKSEYADYLRTSYGAVLSATVGDYIDPQTGERAHGLRCPFPLAAGHWYNHYDDFGNARSYGYKRRHLGHDIMGGVGTPIVAVEGGTVTECGWNRYGGWRIGIRSDDTLRYYYYAHLRKDHPFAAGMETGKRVAAGDVIGYLGVTGYSSKENVNLRSCSPHLHFGLQLIFCPEQESGAKEIWVDLYALTRFLASYRVTAVKGDNGDYTAANQRVWA
ncbi:MAG: M23 family metallopeptidase [Clostridia bacterium]|nr:M23 family metallopeptidase [Clostridia bacterium]